MSGLRSDTTPDENAPAGRPNLFGGPAPRVPPRGLRPRPSWGGLNAFSRENEILTVGGTDGFGYDAECVEPKPL
jgi:hypothetical protein